VINEHTLEMDSAEGVPRRSVIRSSWCTAFFPGKSGFTVSNSANIHPTLQISIAGVYCKSQMTNLGPWNPITSSRKWKQCPANSLTISVLNYNASHVPCVQYSQIRLLDIPGKTRIAANSSRQVEGYKHLTIVFFYNDNNNNNNNRTVRGLSSANPTIKLR
jgi:hypothetical protein